MSLLPVLRAAYYLGPILSRDRPMTTMKFSRADLPEGFLFGAATIYQIETGVWRGGSPLGQLCHNR